MIRKLSATVVGLAVLGVAGCAGDTDAGSDAAPAETTETRTADEATTDTAGAAKVEVIAHRGASGYRPEHTLAGYQLAIEQCADYIEPDVVSTKDGVLVARHENEISGTTDVADHPEFADRETTKEIDGEEITGWFTEDFTLEELRTLRAVERIPDLRPDNTEYDGQFEVPTFEEVVLLAKDSQTCGGEPVGVAPEIKHPTYFASIDLAMEEEVARILEVNGFTDAEHPAIIQSFEVGNLRELNGLTDVRLAQLIDCEGAPFDAESAGDALTYADMLTPEGLAHIASYADFLAPCKSLMIPVGEDGALGEPTSVITDAHDAGLRVVGWTFRAENDFLPEALRNGDDPAAHGDMAAEITAFVDAGMDVVFSDQPDLAVEALGERAAR